MFQHSIEEQRDRLYEEYKVLRDKAQLIQDKFLNGRNLRTALKESKMSDADAQVLKARDEKFREILAFEDKHQLPHKISSPSSAVRLQGNQAKPPEAKSSTMFKPHPVDQDATPPPPAPNITGPGSKQ